MLEESFHRREKSFGGYLEEEGAKATQCFEPQAFFPDLHPILSSSLGKRSHCRDVSHVGRVSGS